MKQTSVVIKAPQFKIAEFIIKGVSPLIIHRFSAKTKLQMKAKMEMGKAASSRKDREAKKTDDLYQEARYISSNNWDGFNASALRCALISACRLVNFKMTLAKLSVFVEPDGYDKLEPQIPLIRIYGKSEKLESIARVETGQPYVCVRSMFREWECKVHIKFDADQFTLDDISNLLTRVGAQVGLGEGRPDSKNSAGMGMGLFAIVNKKEVKQ
jgi:hypothetical protein